MHCVPCCDGDDAGRIQKPWPLSSGMSDHQFRSAEDYRDHLPCATCEPDAAATKAKAKIKKAKTVDEAFEAVRAELTSAMAKFPPFNSAHEGHSVIEEEFDELWDEIKLKQGARTLENMRAEAVQVAAMAIRFIVDVCNPEKVQK